MEQVLNDETFAIMVLMALFTTFMTTPLLMVLYKPARNPIPYTHRKLDMDDSKNVLRILSCAHGMKNVPAMINLTEAMRGIPKHALRLYTLHLVELSERTSSILLVQRARRDGRPYFNQGNQEEDRDQVAVAFKTYGQLSKVTSLLDYVFPPVFCGSQVASMDVSGYNFERHGMASNSYSHVSHVPIAMYKSCKLQIYMICWFSSCI